MPGRIHYSFKGPALVGQSLTQNATQNTLPAQEGMVDVDFPCRFTERPAFTYGFEHAENAAVDALVPMVASVVSWRQGRRDETGLAFYDGARILITAPAVAAAAPVSGVSCLTIDDSGGASVGDGSSVRIPFDTVVTEDGVHGVTAGAFAGVWTLPAGIYTISTSCGWPATTGGIRQILLGGSVWPGASPPKIRIPATTSGETLLALAFGLLTAGGDLEFYGSQTSGGSGTMFGKHLTIIRHA